MLKLYNVTEADAGEYICKVSNYIGEANQSAWLMVLPDKGNKSLLKKAGCRSWKEIGALGFCRQLVG